MAFDYFEVECPEQVGGEYYRRLAGVVLLDHDLVKVISKLHILIDPRVPIFVATGVTRKLPPPVKVGDIAAVNIQGEKVVLSIGDETHLAALLRLLWDRFGKERVDQPDRFTVLMQLTPGESEGIEEIVVTDPSETLYKDLIYALQTIAPEGFKVRRQYYGQGRFYFVASENTLPDDILTLVREKFALMGESL
ncbi:MAG: methanogenesis marker 17 protein [Methanoregulaceae archaeon]|nr:methanogenesis marker 17 protein [Methanoregulaceae archaeon]